MQDIWHQLNHHTVIVEVEKIVSEKLSGILIQRNSYINRVFELEKYDSQERIIVKFYRPSRWEKHLIQEEHDFLKKLTEQEIPVIPPITYQGKTIFTFEGIYFAIFPKKGGRALDEFDKDSWQLIGRLLGRMHLIGEQYQQSQRIRWTPKIATKNHSQLLLEKEFIPDNFKQSFEKTIAMFLEKSEPLFEQEQMILLHGDCHKGNLIHRLDEGIYIVDFDDASLGPAIQDLWMLLPGNKFEAEQEITWFLEGYETFRNFNYTSLNLIEPLRVMRMIHFAAWCAMQSDDSNFETNFPDWGTTRYWNSLIRDIQEVVYRL